jgi:hypothetical protein
MKVVTLKTLQATPKPAHRAARSRKDLMMQSRAMWGVAGVALTLTGLSLSHLTCGIEQVTGGDRIESAAMAMGIDLSFIALEVAQVINLPAETTKLVKRFATPAIIGTMAASAGLNAFGFAHHAPDAMRIPAVILGGAVPALIYALTRVAVALARSDTPKSRKD